MLYLIKSVNFMPSVYQFIVVNKARYPQKQKSRKAASLGFLVKVPYNLLTTAWSCLFSIHENKKPTSRDGRFLANVRVQLLGVVYLVYSIFSVVQVGFSITQLLVFGLYLQGQNAYLYVPETLV